MPSDEISMEAGPHNLVWIEPIWKEDASCKAVRSAYAVVANADFIENPLSVTPALTWIPLGKHRILSSGATFIHRKSW